MTHDDTTQRIQTQALATARYKARQPWTVQHDTWTVETPERDYRVEALPGESLQTVLLACWGRDGDRTWSVEYDRESGTWTVLRASYVVADLVYTDCPHCTTFKLLPATSTTAGATR